MKEVYRPRDKHYMPGDDDELVLRQMDTIMRDQDLILMPL